MRASGELQENLLQAHRRWTKLIQIPSRLNHCTRQISADKAAFLGVNLEYSAAVDLLFARGPAHSGYVLQPVLYCRNLQSAAPACDFEQNGFGATRAGLQIANRIGRHQLSLINNDDLLAGLLDLGQDVRAQNDGVFAGKILDQIACFIDLLGIEPSRWFVENEHIRIVNDGLCESDALPIAFRQFSEKLLSDVGHGATLADIIDALLQLRPRESL